MKVKKNYLEIFIQIVLFALLGCLLWWRWQVGMTRFFDVDEFSYLHWTAELVKGQRPYVDFFMFFGPGFLWFFAPLVKIYWMSASLFIAARVVAFVIFLGILGSLGYLFGKTRNWKWALLPVIILAFLPMPYDKFLEVRPDNLATLIGLIGLIGQIGWLQNGKKHWAFWSGVLYSLSLLVLVKMLPFVVVGILVALLTKSNKIAFFAGLAVPFVFFFLWLLTLGDLSTAWYSLTKLPFESNRIGVLDIMEPHLFFFPNASFYGGWGMTWGFIANHALWIIGIMMAVVRIFTPYITARGDKKHVLVELLIGGIFALSVFGYVQFFPLKHSQYLIPIAIFMAYYAADFISLALERLSNIWLLIVIVFFGFGLMHINAQVNGLKLLASNSVQIAEVQNLLATVPSYAKVLDLDGRMVFWPDAYYICCVPFGSFTQFMSKKPPNLAASLEKNKAQYIFQGNSGRLGQLLPQDRAYIESHYEAVEGWGDALLRRK